MSEATDQAGSRRWALAAIGLMLMQGLVGVSSAGALGYGAAPSIFMIGGAVFILLAWISAATVMGARHQVAFLIFDVVFWSALIIVTAWAAWVARGEVPDWWAYVAVPIGILGGGLYGITGLFWFVEQVEMRVALAGLPALGVTVLSYWLAQRRAS